MKIKQVSCEQFAGISNLDVSFDDGINVVYGKNESGKSTLVNLISRTLFQKARLDKRTDGKFIGSYFPVAKKGAYAGDFIDGKVKLEAEDGDYIVMKEWGDSSSVRLTTPCAKISNQTTVDEVLKGILVYGEGVYSDMLFSSQYNADVSLQTLLDSSQRTDAKQEITDAVSKAFAESDGISVDVVEQAINQKIEDIQGKHWDVAAGKPEYKRGGDRHKQALGEVLKAYYELEDANAVLEEIARLESDADRTAKDYVAKDADATFAQEKYNNFNTYSNRLALQSDRKKLVQQKEKELEKIKDVLSMWPALCDVLEKAKDLQTQQHNRAVLDKYNLAKQIADELAEIPDKVLSAPCPLESEIASAHIAQRGIASCENKLCGMNLTAAIKMLGSDMVEITSLRTGEKLDISDGNAAITEAVRITVPNVFEMQLSPADVDVDDIEKKIAQHKETLESLFEKYGVTSVAELESLAKSVSDAKEKAKNANGRLELVLAGDTFEDLESAAKDIGADVPEKSVIDKEISGLCAGVQIGSFVASKQTVVDGYASEYGDVANLKVKAFDLQCELDKAKASVVSEDDIPSEYLAVTDPEAYLENLYNELQAKQSLREAALTQKTAAASNLEAFKNRVSDDPYADKAKAQQKFDEQKSLLAHWLNIKKAFEAQKSGVSAEPMRDIADKFTEYLSVISSGRVYSDFPDIDKLDMDIYSDDRHIDYQKLSEGTKETVSLAFRLAVLDHLFPDGGGVIVFDDPFTDMDEERTLQACDLLKECAKRHQVIFLTCKEEYISMLAGNTIRF